MTESQSHGFLFEEQVKQGISKYLDSVTINYTNKWDIPPISVKSFKFDISKSNNRVYFGSIENMFKIQDGFFLALIGYEQKGRVKEVVFSDFIFIEVKDLQNLKGELELKELEMLSTKIKSFKEGFHEEAREWYKSILPEYSMKTSFQINFKVDSKKQRRIQCSLTIEELYKKLKRELILVNKLNINNIDSNPRERNTLG
ncbi:hypothetical protein [Poseidonibacter ostreae]|uniref:Uncharacterized protein n=1 Tax=Poseidonibacter ostreae TaxID=2654171 RepID=A0A6L4WP38_9BACT|nr:hypothetical protein [Poseidonibacter ostreae]KAB7884296.1 hypothetical protein GA417_12305 [Poseidonibacter ostreae]KAB7885279.1 hypothetical protein GBG19_14410 [Poseidonibacter ostreae]KAB7891965.1 hypothetical protein GBG18_05095 [Poseidonibacter ostreae]